MTNPKLYVELTGPIIQPAHYDEAMPLAPYARPFMHWAAQHFNVQWLTDRSPVDAFHVAKQLGLPSDKVPVRGFEVTKTEVLDPQENFYWVDCELIPDEVAWLAKHGQVHRFISVDPLKGITPEHKEKLEALLKKRT